MKKHTVSLKLTSSLLALSSANSNELDVLLQIQGLKSPPTKKRPKLNLSLVIDVSGSMIGNPIENAKQSAISLIDRLNENDRLSLVTYSNAAQILSPSIQLNDNNKILLKSKIHSIRAEGGTALHSGWLHGAQTLAPFVKDYGLSRILLLSDGQANIGVQDINQIKKEAQQLLESGIGTSSYGLGISFNENLMTAISCGGHAFYAENANQLSAYFDTDFDLMSCVAVKNVFCNIICDVDGAEHEYEVLNDIMCVNQKYHLPDVIFEGASWMVVRCNIKPQEKASLRMDVSWTSLDGKTEHQSILLDLKVASHSKKNKDKEVSVLEERVKELFAARIQKEALAEAQKGQWQNVNSLINKMSGMANGNAYVAGIAQNMSSLAATKNVNLMSKEATYSSHTMSTRSSLINEDVTVSSDCLGLRKIKQGEASPIQKISKSK